MSNGNGNGNGAIVRLRGELESRKDAMLRMLPARVGGGERFAELMLAVVSTPEIAACTPSSVVAAAYACARLGLTPDPILGHIYIIPRSVKVRGYGTPERWEKRAGVQIGYKGMVELARRSGVVRSINVEVVYDGDNFRYWSDENGKHIRHEPQIDRAANARPLAVYCVAEMAGGGWPQVEVMPWSEVQRIRQTFADENSPAWKSNEIEMGKKTVVRRASKLWPQSPELGQAVQWEEQAERGESQSLPEITAEVPAMSNEQPRRRSLIARDAGNGHDPENGAPPDDDFDTPAGGEDAPSFEGSEQAASVPTEAPAPAAPAQAPTKTKASPKGEPTMEEALNTPFPGDDPLTVPGEDGAPSIAEQCRIEVEDCPIATLKSQWMKLAQERRIRFLQDAGLKSAVEDDDLRRVMVIVYMDQKRRAMATAGT